MHLPRATATDQQWHYLDIAILAKQPLDKRQLNLKPVFLAVRIIQNLNLRPRKGGLKPRQITLNRAKRCGKPIRLGKGYTLKRHAMRRADNHNAFDRIFKGAHRGKAKGGKAA